MILLLYSSPKSSQKEGRRGGRALTNKGSRGEEGWGGMDNDYLAPVFVTNKWSRGGKEEGHG